MMLDIDSSDADPRDPPRTEPTPTPTLAVCDEGLDEVLSWGGLSNRAPLTDVDWAAMPEATPRNAFSSQQVESVSGVQTLLADSSAAAGLLEDVLPADEVDRALYEEHWVAVQLHRTLKLPTNYQLIDGTAVKHPSTASAGEVLWVYVPADTCGTDRTLVIRAWCGNPSVWVRKD